MSAMKAIHIKSAITEKKTQYVLMVKRNGMWLIYQGIWADHDDDAREIGGMQVEDIQNRYPDIFKDSIFTVMKMLSTNGDEEI